MKKALLLSLACCFSLGLIGTKASHCDASSDRDLVSGGTISFDFGKQEDLARFSMYTSGNTLPRVIDGEVYSYFYEEQKIILKDVELSEYLIEADFGPSVYKGHIDMGLFINCKYPGNLVDQITGWEVNIKKDEEKDYWDLKLYKFQNRAWAGTFQEVSHLKFWEDEWIHLSCIVKNGNVKAYLNNDYSEPLINYNIETQSGLVGIRSFKCPAKFTNLQITSPSFSKDLTRLNSLIDASEYMSSSKYAPKSWAAYQQAISNGRAAKLNSSINQLEINDICDAIENAKNELLIKHSFAELQTLIAECEAISNENEIYTKNSYKSLLICIENAKEMTAESSIDDISYHYYMLNYRRAELIKYGGQ